MLFESELNEADAKGSITPVDVTDVRRSRVWIQTTDRRQEKRFDTHLFRLPH